VPSTWSVKKVKNRYYLYHRGQYVGPLDEIVNCWKKCAMAPGAGFEPARGACPTGSQGRETAGSNKRIDEFIDRVKEVMADGVIVERVVVEGFNNYENDESGSDEERTIWEFHMED